MFVFGFLLCTDGGRPVECGDAPQTQSRRAEERSGKMRSLKLRVGTSGKVSEPHDDDIGTYHAGGPCIAPAVAGSGFIEELASRTANRHRFTARSQHAAKDKLRFTRKHIDLGRGGLSFEEPKRPKEPFPRDHGVELGGVSHGDFCAPQNKGEPVPIFVMGELNTGAFEESPDGVVCDCCGKTTHIFYTAPFYAVEDIAYLCPECIANGEAARKYDGSFQDDFSVDDGVDDPEKLDELIHRTPGYSGWQQEYWRAHCGDYCAYLGHVGARELRALGVLEEVLDDPMWDEAQKDMIRESVNGGHLQCYLFQCLHCGKHLVWMDFD